MSCTRVVWVLVVSVAGSLCLGCSPERFVEEEPTIEEQEEPESPVINTPPSSGFERSPARPETERPSNP